MRVMLKNFLHDQTGAVTVDWVVLTAAVVGLAFSLVYIFADGNTTLADSMSGKVAAITPDAGN
ncbi:hypothetical protein [Actibacterium sp. XHP0104]|uniref:hypothetical protein n=1 Tax=Actibacterium sp. XHP0104 TaxID=2984335 RepID=UPI0021E75A8D|nr:hypothetical protein [Actibacterium sp. XHP0104]MCV2880518.1 hypothetical protein [Actibacterium sp. XHP0104]